MSKRERCSVCGVFLRGTWSDLHACEAGVVRCHVCPLLAMTSQDVVMYVGKDASWPSKHTLTTREKWRGREDEANAWQFECEIREVPDDAYSDAMWMGTWYTTGGTLGPGVEAAIVATKDGQPIIERILAARRPRAVVEYSGDIGRRRIYGALESVRIQLAETWRMEIETNVDDTRDAPAADARVGHTSRDVPSFSVHDRYREGEPRAAYMTGLVLAVENADGSITPTEEGLRLRKREPAGFYNTVVNRRRAFGMFTGVTN